MVKEVDSELKWIDTFGFTVDVDPESSAAEFPVLKLRKYVRELLPIHCCFIDP